MSAFDDAMSQADVALFGVFGTAATVQRGADPAVPVTVVVDRNVAKLGDYGQVVQRVDRISLRNSEWVCIRGDAFVIDGIGRRTVESLEDDDGLVNTAVLHV